MRQTMVFPCPLYGNIRQEVIFVDRTEHLTNPRFPLFHVPHDGRLLPKELLASVCVPMREFLFYDAVMRDVGVTRLVPRAYAARTYTERFPISRLLCDVERFIGPEEIMERCGMGFCYERAYDGRRIKTVTGELRKLTRRYYDAHHAEMDARCFQHPKMILFDMHSYHDEVVPAEFLTAMPTPDVCIGADERYTPPELVEIVRRRFEDAGYSVAVNYPYSGTFVPNAVLSKASGCDLISVMLEFHKRCYCDGALTPIAKKQAAIRTILERVVEACAGL